MSRYAYYFEKYGTIIGLVLLIIILTFSSPYFLTVSNLMSVLRQGVALSLVAIGMTYAVVSGGIDLSVGSIMALSGCTTALLMVNFSANWILACLVGIAIGILSGMILGYFIAFWNLQPFIMSLVMMSAARGLALVLTNGIPVAGFPPNFAFLGTGWVLGIPFPVIASVIIVIIFDFLLKNWAPLNRAFHVGANPDNAELLGINVKRTVFLGFALCGLFSGISAIFMCSRLAMGYAQFGLEIELRALGAAVIGGATFSGGRGSIWGTFLGVLLLALINNGFVLMDASIYWQKVVNGTILIIAIATAVRHAKRK